MESIATNRYLMFGRILEKLEKSRNADQNMNFVREGTALNFTYAFDIAWKVMKDILVKNMGILDNATSSPRKTLQQAFANHLIDDDCWMQMLKTRKNLVYDYDGSLALEKFNDIIDSYYPLLQKFYKVAERYQ